MVTRNHLFLIIFFFFLMQLSWVDAIQYNIDLSKNNVEAGEIFQINLEVFNTRNVSVSFLGEDPNVLIKEAGKSTSFSIINGQQTSSVTFTYIAKINKEGKYSIGPFQIKGRNNSTDTEPLSVEVRETKDNSAFHAQTEAPAECFLKVSASKTSLYAGEYVDISVRFYTSVETRVNDYKQLTFPSSAWIENIKSDDDYKGKVQINGLTYDEYEIEKKRVFISAAGEYKISPVMLNLYVFSRTSMFSYYSTPITLKSEPIILTVQELPKDPSIKFAGKTIPVGTFTREIHFSTQETMENTPITMSVTLNGSGNFHVINAPLDIDYGENVEVFSSKSNEIKNANRTVAKRWEILLIPKQAGQVTLKVNDFIFFDTEKKSYQKSPGNTYILTIKADPNKKNSSSTSPFVIPAIQTTDKNEHSPSLSPILISNVLGEKSRFPILRWSVILMGILYLIFFSFVLFFFLFHYIVKPYSLCKKNTPIVTLEKGVHKTIRESHRNKVHESAEQLYYLLEQFIIRQFKIDSVDITKNTIKEKLNGKLSEEKIDNLIEVISEFDMIRFGGMDITDKELLRLSEVILRVCQKLLES